MNDSDDLAGDAVDSGSDATTPTEVSLEMAAIIREQAGRLLRGAAEDVNAYAAAIAADAAQAAALGRDDLLQHLKAQTAALGEKHRLAGASAAWGTLSELIYAMGRVALVAAA